MGIEVKINMKKRSKRYKKLISLTVKDKKLSAKEILDLLKKNSPT